MPWDNDLEALSQRVKDTLGVKAYNDAMRRAMGVALQKCEPLDPDSALTELLPPEERSPHVEISYDLLSSALRAELQRLLALKG